MRPLEWACPVVFLWYDSEMAEPPWVDVAGAFRVLDSGV